MIRTCSMYPKSPPTSGLSNAPTLMVIRPLSHFLFTNEYKSVHPPQVLSLLDRASLYIQDNNIWTLQGKINSIPGDKRHTQPGNKRNSIPDPHIDQKRAKRFARLDWTYIQHCPENQCLSPQFGIFQYVET